MISSSIDVTAAYNANGKVQLDLSGWEFVTIQIVTPSGTTTFGGSDDPGEIQGVYAGDAYTATNWQALSLTNTATNTNATSTTTNGIFRGVVLSRFLQLAGASAAKVLVFTSKN